MGVFQAAKPPETPPPLSYPELKLLLTLFDDERDGVGDGVRVGQGVRVGVGVRVGQGVRVGVCTGGNTGVGV